MALRIDTARPCERVAVVTLLQKAGLLTNDLPTDLSDFLLAWDGDELVGVAGLERPAVVGLLRSVAVDPAYRNTGIAAQLVERLLAKADATHVQPIYLITTTAEGYFSRYAFTPVHRGDVPDAIRQTRQFSDLCPASAVVMKRIAPQPL
jgi:amino-acid N-acetyltransferase